MLACSGTVKGKIKRSFCQSPRQIRIGSIWNLWPHDYIGQEKFSHVALLSGSFKPISQHFVASAAFSVQANRARPWDASVPRPPRSPSIWSVFSALYRKNVVCGWSPRYFCTRPVIDEITIYSVLPAHRVRTVCKHHDRGKKRLTNTRYLRLAMVWTTWAQLRLMLLYLLTFLRASVATVFSLNVSTSRYQR